MSIHDYVSVIKYEYNLSGALRKWCKTSLPEDCKWSAHIYSSDMMFHVIAVSFADPRHKTLFDLYWSNTYKVYSKLDDCFEAQEKDFEEIMGRVGKS